VRCCSPQEGTGNELTKRGLFISPTGVRSVWLRHDLETFRKRLKELEAKADQEDLVLNEEQFQAMERARAETEARGEIETAHPGYRRPGYLLRGHHQERGADLSANLSRYVHYWPLTSCYDRKNALLAANMLNGRVLPFF
jgi:hypothetical protein